jgi:hypothetical protein
MKKLPLIKMKGKHFHSNEEEGDVLYSACVKKLNTIFFGIKSLHIYEGQNQKSTSDKLVL